jgi:uncharacterized YccA/Bax inhibitor family protein
LPDSAHIFLRKYERLWYQVTNCIRTKHRPALIHEIANALFSSLNFAGSEPQDNFFTEIDEKIGYRTRTIKSLMYLVGTVTSLAIAAIIAVIVLQFSGEGALVYLVGTFAGGLGALLSVFQRIGCLEINPYAARWFAYLQGLARGFIGVLFGNFFVVANKANLVLGTFSENMFAVAAFATVAGISERFIPEIMRRIETCSTDIEIPENQKIGLAKSMDSRVAKPTVARRQS